jgi:thioredoxin reductase
MKKKSVVIAGVGFAGLGAAMYPDKTLALRSTQINNVWCMSRGSQEKWTRI